MFCTLFLHIFGVIINSDFCESILAMTKKTSPNTSTIMEWVTQSKSSAKFSYFQHHPSNTSAAARPNEADDGNNTESPTIQAKQQKTGSKSNKVLLDAWDAQSHG